MIDDAQNNLEKRRVPALVTYLSPFRVVVKNNTRPWSATIEQVNGRTWDYVALHEIVGGVEVGLPAPYHMAICRDGALALPPLPQFQSDQSAVNFFNRCLAGLLIGGIYCEAISADGLDLGSIIDWKYLRVSKEGQAATNRFHNHIRQRQAAPLEAIQLHHPRSVILEHLVEAMKCGLDTLENLRPLQGEYLLKGITGVARRDWGAALINFWIVAEQLLEALWSREVPERIEPCEPNKARLGQLSDNRTWTAATKIELLYQRSVIDLGTLTKLSHARKARNELTHRGIHPSKADVDAAYFGTRGLVTAILGHSNVPLFDLDLSDHSLSDPFAPPPSGPLEPLFWMSIPKLPGEEELEIAEASARTRRGIEPT